MMTWNVYLTGFPAVELGQVHAASEALARCAALSKYGIDEDEWELMDSTMRREARKSGIPPDAQFSVSGA